MDVLNEMNPSPINGDEYLIITCSEYDGKMCISLTGELVPGDDIRLTTVGEYESLAFAEETTKDDESVTSSFIPKNCFKTVLSNKETTTIFEPIYGKYIDDAQEDELCKDDLMYHGYYNRTASRYVIPYSLLLSFLEDGTTKSFLLTDIPEIFEYTLISEDSICSKLFRWF